MAKVLAYFILIIYTVQTVINGRKTVDSCQRVAFGRFFVFILKIILKKFYFFTKNDIMCA